MRLVLELIIAAALIALGWEKSLRERINEIRGSTDKVTADHSQSSTLHPRPSPSVPGSWMWDVNHKSTLDPPKKSPTPEHR